MDAPGEVAVSHDVADMSCKQSAGLHNVNVIHDNEDEATSPCGIGGSASAAVTHATHSIVDARDTIVNGGCHADSFNVNGNSNGSITSKEEIEELGELTEAIKFCDEEEEETEIFFGAVTEKEQRKASKYGNRRTAVFQPKFRHDRSLMRYTDYHVLAKVLEDEEEQEEVEAAAAEKDHPVLNGFHQELDDIRETNEVEPTKNESHNSGGSHDTNNDSLTNSSSSDFQVSMRSPNLDVYRIVHLSDISADEDSANSSRNNSVYFQSGNTLLNGIRDADTESFVTAANSLQGSHQFENVSENNITREVEPSRELDQVSRSAEESHKKVVAKPEIVMGKPAPDVEVVSVFDASLTHNRTMEQPDDVDKPVNSIESVCSDNVNEEYSKMILEQDDADKKEESDSKESESSDATENKLAIEGLVHSLNGLDLQRDSLDGSRPDINKSTFDISVDSLDASPGKLIIAETESPDLSQNNSLVEDISQDSLETSKLNPTEPTEKDSRLCDTSLSAVHRDTENSGNNSRDLFADDSPYCAFKNDDVEAEIETGATPAIPQNSNTISHIAQDSRATGAQQRLPRTAMSTPISLHATACHRSAFSAFITPIKQPSESSLVLGNTVETAESSSQLEEGSDLALTRANVCQIGSMGSELKTDDSQSCLAKSTDQSEVLFQSFLASNINVTGDEEMGPVLSKDVKEEETDAGEDEARNFFKAVETEQKLVTETTEAMQRESVQTEASPIKQVVTCQSDVSPKSSVENFNSLSEDAPKLEFQTGASPIKQVVTCQSDVSPKSSVENFISLSEDAPKLPVENFSPPSNNASKSLVANLSSLSENAEMLKSPAINHSQSSMVFTETRFSPNLFNRSLASPSQTASRTDLSQLEDSDVVVFKEVGFSPTVQNTSIDQPEVRRVHCFSPTVPRYQSGLDIVTVSANDTSLSNVTCSSSADADDEKDEGVGSGDEELLTPPSASHPDSSPSLVPRQQQLQENLSTSAPVTNLFPQAASSVLTQARNSLAKQKTKSPFPPRVKSTPKVRAKTTKLVGTPHGRTPTPTVRSAFGRSVQTAAKTPPAPNPKLLRHTPVSTGKRAPAAVSKSNPPVFKGGTPRYLPGQKKQTLAQSPANLKRAAPPKFDLDDSPAAKSPANRSTLEEKKNKLEILQEEKRRVQEKLAKMQQQSPLPSTGKSPTRPTVSPVPVRMPLTPTSADNLPRVRYKDTQSPSQALYLNPAELEAVTKIHTLCNAQQISKIVTKARAGGSPVTTAKHRIAYKEASKLQWQEDLIAEGNDKHSPAGTEIPAKSILHIRPAEDIFPYNDQQPSPVVIRKLAKRTNTLCPSKT